MALDVYGSSPLSPEAARELIESVTDRGVLFDLLCRGIRSRVAFAAVFTIHGDVAFGRTALGAEFFDRTQLGRISVQLDRTSPFRVAAKERTAYVGRVGEQAASAEPLRAMNRTTPVEGAILPIQLKGRAVALLYLDDDGYALASDLVDDLRALISDVGQALSRIQQQSKSGGLGVSVDGSVGEEVREGGTSAWRSPSSKSPALESQATPLPPAKPASDSPVPVLLADQATQPLHTTKAPKESAIPAAVAAQPTVPLGKPAAGNTSQKAKPTSPAAKAPQKADATAAKASEATAAAAPPSTASPGKSDLAALVERAGNKDEAAVALLIDGGLEAARAVVAALPGPLRSNDRQALGDPVGGPVWSRGPLLGLVLRIGHIAVEPILERLKDTSLPAETRYHLTLCLGEMPLPSTVVPLGQLLFDGDETVRMAAVTALRNFPPSAELSTLISQLRDTIDSNDNRRAHHAIEAVGELRVTSAVMQLINLLDTDDSALIDAIGRALQTITKQDFGQSRIRWSSWWRRRQDEPRLQWLLEGLAHSSAMLRSAAQDELTSLSGDVVGYRFDQPRRERDQLRKRWAQWWQRRGYPVN